jgi:3-hydroxyisobutyrate dehydrogenase-like beta-hydroxyacid dehydrogenase
MNVGLIGTGTMGQPMLANLVGKGCSVTAYDLAPAALDAAVRLGAARAAPAREAAQQLYRMASAHGWGRQDFASVYQFLKPSGDDAPV